MAGEHSTLANELNKLKKTELIDLITLHKLPTNFITSEILVSFKTKLQIAVQQATETEINVESDEADLCCKKKCVHLKINAETLEVKVNGLNKLVTHLEGRLLDQQDIITLLKECSSIRNQSKDETSNTKTIAKPSIKKFNNVVSNDKQKNLTDNKTVTNGYECALKGTSSNQTKKEEQKTRDKITAEQVSTAINYAQKTTTNYSQSTTQRNYAKNSKPIIGKSNINIVKSIPKQGYLHVYRLHPETTVDLLMSFLKKSAPSIKFGCEQLEKKDNSTASFKVCFPIVDCAKVYDPDIWPDGAAVRRFTFRPTSGRNFQLAASEEIRNP